MSLAIFHPHFVIRIFASAFYHPHFSIRVLSAAFFHPHFIIRIFPSAFYQPHFSIRILSAAFFYPPSAIRRHPVRTLQRPQQIAFLWFWHMQAQCRILKSRQEHIFVEWMKNSFSWEKTYSFERNTILRHFPGTLKVFFWLTHPFLFNNVTLFISRGCAQLACLAENRFISILVSKMLASFSR